VLLMGPRAAPIAFEPRFAHLPGTPLSSGTLSLSLGEGAARFFGRIERETFMAYTPQKAGRRYRWLREKLARRRRWRRGLRKCGAGHNHGYLSVKTGVEY
jgi:hypothetical protein